MLCECFCPGVILMLKNSAKYLEEGLITVSAVSLEVDAQQ